MRGRKRRKPAPPKQDSRPDLLEERLQPDRHGDADGERAPYLRAVYVVLAGIVVAAAAAAIVFPEIDLVDTFGANLATETLGILLTLVFVHRFLDQQDRARRMRASIGALRKGSRSLDRVVGTWVALLKGVERIDRAPPATLNGLFADHITESLRYCDPAVERPLPDGGTERWVVWAAEQFAAAQRNLNGIIVTYGASLDPAYVEALDELVDDAFFHVIAEVAALPPDRRDWRVRLNTARALRQTHFERLLRVVRLHNRLAAEAATLRTRSTAPRSSALGVGLSLDADLRVQTRVQPWWRNAPDVGELRREGA